MVPARHAKKRAHGLANLIEMQHAARVSGAACATEPCDAGHDCAVCHEPIVHTVINTRCMCVTRSVCGTCAEKLARLWQLRCPLCRERWRCMQCDDSRCVQEYAATVASVALSADERRKIGGCAAVTWAFDTMEVIGCFDQIEMVWNSTRDSGEWLEKTALRGSADVECVEQVVHNAEGEIDRGMRALCDVLRGKKRADRFVLGRHIYGWDYVASCRGQEARLFLTRRGDLNIAYKTRMDVLLHDLEMLWDVLMTPGDEDDAWSDDDEYNSEDDGPREEHEFARWMHAVGRKW